MSSVTKGPRFVLRTFASWFGVYNVKHYGAKGNGTTDDTAAIQACLSAAQAGGGECFFPPGTYKTTSTISLSGGIGVTVRGSGTWVDGGNATVIVPTHNTDVFSFAPSSSSRCRIQDLRIQAASARSGGAGVHMAACCWDVHNVVTVYCNIGFLVDGSAVFNCWMSNCTWAYNTTVGVKLVADGIAGDWYIQNTNIDNVGLTPGTTIGLWCKNLSGCWFSNMEINTFGTGVYFDPTYTTYPCNYSYFTNIIVDSSTLCWDVQAGWSLHFNDCYGTPTSGSGTIAVKVRGGRNIIWRGGTFVYWTDAVFDVTGGSYLVFDGVNMHANPGGGSTATGKPLRLASGISHVKFTGNHCDGMNGAITLGGSHTYLHIEGNTGMGAAISGTTTGTGNRVANNEVSGTWS